MKYIENNGEITREYEVQINTKTLEEVIKELTEKCYRVVNRETKVFANNEEEAIEKINANDKSGIKVKGLTNISEKDNRGETLGLQVFNCEYLYKQNSELVKILETILSNYRSTLGFKNQNYREIDRLIQFKDSEELVPYTVRLLHLGEQTADAIKSNGKVDKDLEEKVNATIQEADNNKEFDFTLLNDLYERAKDCFGFILVAETVHYNDSSKGTMVYKLGSINRK